MRAFKAVGGSPHFIARASGARITDIDGNTFIDYVGSWGPMIHGHAPRGLISAIAKQARLGTSFGAAVYEARVVLPLWTRTVTGAFQWAADLSRRTDAGRRSGLYRISVDGGTPRRITTPQAGSDPDWSRPRE